MAAAETARLIASLELQDKNFTRGIRNVERGVSRVDKKLGAFSGFVNRNMGRAIDSIALKFTQSIGTGLESLAELEDATTAVTGSITQVGKDWTTTGEDIAKWANEIEADTEAAFDDKAIVQATNTLIRYGKVSEDNLRPAMEVMTDLAARTGDEGSAATLLAKALADPAKAAGKLARQGIILTKAQQKQLKQMVKVNDIAGAQALLLDILADTTKGAAKASAGPYRDALNQMGDAAEDAQRALAVGFLPVIKEVAGVLTEELGKPETIETLKSVGTSLAGTLRSIIGVAKQLPWEQIGASLKLAGTGAKAVLDAFLGLPPWIQTAVLTGWGLNKLTGGALSGIFTGLASGLIKGVLGMNAGVVNINAGVVNGAPGVPGGGGGGLIGTAARLVIPVAIASIAVGAAATLAGMIDPQFNNPPGGPNDRPLANRDPRRFDKYGRVIAQFTSQTAKNTGKTAENTGGAPGAHRPRAHEPGVGDRPSPGNPGLFKKNLDKIGFDKWVTKAGEIKNAVTTTSAAQTAEIGNVKNAVATMDANQKAALVAQTAVNAAGNMLSVFQSANQVLAAAGTTAAVNTNASATRGVAPPIVSTLYAISSNITGAIAANRPVIQSTNVVNNYTRTQRTGSSSGSRASGTGPDI